MNEPVLPAAQTAPPAVPPEVRELIANWWRRQSVKALAALSTFAGTNISDPDGHVAAWFLAVLFWLWEILLSWKSHRAIRAEKEGEA